MWKIGNKDFQLSTQETQFQEDHKFKSDNNLVPRVLSYPGNEVGLIIVFIFLKNFRWNIVNVFWVVLKTADKMCEKHVGQSVRLEGFAQVTQPLVCLTFCFPSFNCFFYDGIYNGNY